MILSSDKESTEGVLLLRFLLFGFLFGICFPVMALLLDLFFKSMSFSLKNLVYLHQVNPIHYIIDSAPVVLASVAYGIGRYVSNREKKIQTNLKHELANTKKIADFSHQLIQGNFNIDVVIDDKSTQDTFLKLKENIENSVEKEKITHWTNEGIALLMEVLKEREDSPEKFASKVISVLSRYLQAFQGAFYQVNYPETEEAYLSLLAGYAIDSMHLREQQWAIGEGLIGQVAQSGKTMYVKKNLKEPPHSHSHSGKKSLVLVPLIHQKKVRGIIELAIFDDLQPYQIAYLEKISDNITIKLY